MKKKLFWVVVALLALTATVLIAAWPRYLPIERMHGEPPEFGSFEEIVDRAELIVLADVKAVQQGPDYVSPIIGTSSTAHYPTQRITLEVVEVYKGDVALGQTVTLYQEGVGVTRSPWPVFRINENDPVYERDERYILMLWPVPISEEVKPYQPEPWQEGMYAVIHPDGRMRLNADGTVTGVLNSFGTNGKALAEIEEMIAVATVVSFNDIIPPPAMLEINGVTQTSAIGTYCWSGGGCADMIGIPTPMEALQISSPITAQLRLPIDTSPSVLLFTIIHVTEKDEMQGNARGYRWWNYEAEGRRLELPLQSQQEIQIDLAPGLYVWEIQVWWDGKGDVIYGLLVEVR